MSAVAKLRKHGIKMEKAGLITPESVSFEFYLGSHRCSISFFRLGRSRPHLCLRVNGRTVRRFNPDEIDLVVPTILDELPLLIFQEGPP